MKKYIAKSISLAALIGCASVMFSSCEDTLDADKYFDDRRTLESVFTDINQTNNWLSQSFAFLKDDLCDVTTKENSGRAFHVFADDVFWGDRDAMLGAGYNAQDSYASFKQGDYNENYGSQYWINAYRGIFQASVFIHNIYRNDKLSEEQRLDMKGQARFVRAYYYWLLLRRYGPVPIMPDEGADYTLDYNDLSIPRSSYEEVAEFISDEMIKACHELQNWSRVTGNTSTENIIRPTRGAALATRALALMYAASPLANGQLANGEHPSLVTDDFAKSFTNKDGKQLLSLTYDERKWARAAAACRDVIDCPAGYDLYHASVNEANNETTGYPKTLTPFKDNDFSEKAWPEGYADIDPYLSYRDLFNGVIGLDNSEIIFSRGYNTSGGRHQSLDGMATHCLPSTLFGWNCHGVTQKMVDAYYMKDGSDCPGRNSEWSEYTNGDYDSRARRTGWTATRANPNRGEYAVANYPEVGSKGTGVSMQYVEREPRFYASVGYNGSFWWNANPEVSTHHMKIYYYRGGTGGSSEGGGNNGVSNTSSYWQRSGIGLKKYVNPQDWRTAKNADDYGHIVQKWEPAIRYADILLMYAECLNELTSAYSIPSWDGASTYNVSRDLNEMKRGIRPVRCRAGVPDFTTDVYADQSLMRKKIKRERMIEFIAEGKRYYDLRRWMDAPVEESIPVYGCNVYMPESQRDEFQRVVPVYSLPTVFNVKMYFWPISTEELKRNRNLVQNPGWKYYD